MSLEQENIQEAVKVVLHFAHRMNEWEARRYVLSRVQEGKYVRPEYLEKYPPSSVEEMDQEYYQIIEETCTQKKRVWGGHPSSWSKDGKYQGIDQSRIVEVNQVKTNRIEVTAQCGLFPDQYFRFVLFKKKGQWRIDHLLSRIGSSDWRRNLI